MSLFTALLAAHVISSAPSCNQVVIKTIEGAVCASLDFDNEINSKITFETGCTYIVTNCDITASAAGEMEHKAGSKFVMRGSTTFTLNGTARVAGGIDIEGGTYLNKNLLLISETGVFRVHQNGTATNGKTGSFYIAGDFVNENLFTNLGADSDGDNDGVPFGVTNDGAITNHKNITNLGTMKNKGTIFNKQGGVINNERQEIAGVATLGSIQSLPAESCDLLYKSNQCPEDGLYWINGGGGDAKELWCDCAEGWTLVYKNGQDKYDDNTRPCFLWSGTSGFSCGSSDLRVSGEGTTYLHLNPPVDANEIKYKGSVYSSGGYNNPVWGAPNSGRRHGYWDNFVCGDNGNKDTTTTVPGSPRDEIKWLVWSDSGNVCGASGAYWIMSEVWVR